MTAREPGSNVLLAVVAAVALLTFLYSVLVTAQVLLWFVLAGLLAFGYLLWRLVRATERIAVALEG